MIMFYVATLIPVALIGLGAIFGGVWAFAALASVTVVVASLDEIVRRVRPAIANGDSQAAAALTIIIGISHFGLLGLVVLALAGDALSTAQKLALFTATGLFMGQVSNSNAHELIHKRNRMQFRLGVWVYISLLFGHHASAHLLVHHQHAATRADPNTSRFGESYYRFVQRAWVGSFKAGLQAETARLRKIGRSQWLNPYITYMAGSALMCVAAIGLAGPKGLICYLAIAGFAQSQLFLADYVQHYGLLRRVNAQGKPEPMGPAHSWDSPHWFSSAFMLNAPRHSDHHAHPAKPFSALSLPPEGPVLPRALPVMACLALVPKAWRTVMDPLATPWRGLN